MAHMPPLFLGFLAPLLQGLIPYVNGGFLPLKRQYLGVLDEKGAQ
jgi:hypothetical protein